MGDNRNRQPRSKTSSAVPKIQFSSVCTAEDHSRLPRMDGEPFPKLYSFTRTDEGLEKLLSSLDPHEATDKDQMSYYTHIPGLAAARWSTSRMETSICNPALQEVRS